MSIYDVETKCLFYEIASKFVDSLNLDLGQSLLQRCCRYLYFRTVIYMQLKKQSFTFSSIFCGRYCYLNDRYDSHNKLLKLDLQSFRFIYFHVHVIMMYLKYSLLTWFTVNIKQKY